MLNEVAALVDVDPDAGDNLDIIQGSGSDAVGAALALLVSSNLDELNATAAFGGTDLVSVTYDAGTDLLTFRFVPAVNVVAGDTIVVTDTDGGTFAASAENVITDGSNGGADVFLFEPTASDNGADIINDATVGATGDVFNFSAFLAAAVGFAGAVNFTAGLDLSAGATNVGIAFNKATLAVGDISLAAAASKVAVEDGSKAIVLVTADVNGVSDTTGNAYLIYYVTNGATAGLGDVSVALVGTVNSTTELNAADWIAGNFA